MSKINPKTSLENQRFIAEQAKKAVELPVDPAKEAALLKAIASLGPDVALLNERALSRVTGLDEGLEARAVLTALATAYGKELHSDLFRSSNVADFAAKILAKRSTLDGGGVEGAINRFVTMWQTEAPFQARDGQELDLSSIAQSKVQEGPMNTKLLRSVGRGDWVPVSVDPKAPFAEFAGGDFGVLRLDNGQWSAWFQNDWNRDAFELSQWSSATLQTVRDRLGDEPGFRGLSKQIDKILASRGTRADDAQRFVFGKMEKLDLSTLPSTEGIAASQIMGLADSSRIGRVEKRSLLGLLAKLAQPAVEAAEGMMHIGDWSARTLHFGDDYAHILHAGQPLASNGAHLAWTVPNEPFPHDGGLIELASGKYRLWTFHPTKRQGSLPAKNHYELGALDTASLTGLRRTIAKITPAGGEDAVIKTARQAHQDGASYTRLLAQIDQILAERASSGD